MATAGSEPVSDDSLPHERLRRHVFDTALGPCCLAWTARGIRSVTLPDTAPGRPATAEAEPPDGFAADAARRITALFDGVADDLADLPLDLTTIGDFERRVYALTRAVRPGRTTTYGAIAAALGDPGAARAVGGALGRNPFPPIVPCHRVLAAGGATGGFSAPGGVDTKRRMLAIEGVILGGGPSLFDHFGVAAPAHRRPGAAG